ncbi:MAG TPA: hypothetical protein PLW97_13360, partial [Synergistaceae bacterium]|nr:hypothetical protein [Synergistaceae bacterium]
RAEAGGLSGGAEIKELLFAQSWKKVKEKKCKIPWAQPKGEKHSERSKNISFSWYYAPKCNYKNFEEFLALKRSFL